MMPAKQRHNHRAIIGHRNNGRLGAFVGQKRRNGANKNTAGADANDRNAGGKQVARMVKRIVKEGIGLVNAARTAVDLGTQMFGNAGSGGHARRPKRQNNGCYSQGSAPFVMRIMEKYGALSGASANDTTSSFGRVAWAT